jgi:uncharacterized protein (TIGR03435 family)
MNLRLAGLLVVISIGIARSQQVAPTSRPQFDVASVRQSAMWRKQPMDSVNAALIRQAAANFSQHGKFELIGGPVNVLIQLAYNVKDFQVLGAPSWANSERYDVNAKAPGDATFEQMRPMLQSLLADLFKLTLRREIRDTPVYELVAAKSGVKIDAAKAGSCVTLDPNIPLPPANQNSLPNYCGVTRKQFVGLPDPRQRIEAIGISMPKLVEMLSDEVGRTVIDKTAFKGTFDLHLEFAPEVPVGVLGPVPPGATNASSAGPSIFTALQDQLGLRLESAKGPVEAIVIDRVERPSEN